MRLGGSTCPGMGRGCWSTASVGTVSPESADTCTGRLGVVPARSVREIGPYTNSSDVDENGMYSSSLLAEGGGEAGEGRLSRAAGGQPRQVNIRLREQGDEMTKNISCYV